MCSEGYGRSWNKYGSRIRKINLLMEVLVLSKKKKEYGPFSPIPGIVSV